MVIRLVSFAYDGIFNGMYMQYEYPEISYGVSIYLYPISLEGSDYSK
jgi:hypothetical protein